MIPRRPPVPARVHDCLAGGYHCDEADVALADRLAEIYPGVRQLVASNRAYLARKARYAVEELGIFQFLYLGPGFPGPGSVRDAAQQAYPDGQVACVDQPPSPST